MNILLTGATGFVGNNLKLFLSKNNLNISIRDLFRSDLTNSEYHLAELFNISRADVIIHLAGKAHDFKKSFDHESYYEINYCLTQKLYNAFLKSDVKSFIFISSVKAVADHVNIPLTEEQNPNPQTHYGKSKLMAEEYIQRQPLPGGKSWYILRPCMIHGPGNKGNLNLLYKLISKGIPYPLASFENKRSFLSIENLCFLIHELLLSSNIPSGVYNVADDEALSTNELISLIAAASDRKPLLWKISPKFIRSLAKLGDFLKLPLTTERLDKLTENYIVDNTKIRQALGKDFPVQAREGIIETIKSFKAQTKQ